jgi:hypothetical protein
VIVIGVSFEAADTIASTVDVPATVADAAKGRAAGNQEKASKSLARRAGAHKKDKQ